MYSVELFDEDADLTISTNFDDTLENITSEADTFILFISLKSLYTPGTINKNTSIWTNEKLTDFISLNVESFKTNRWKVNFEGKSVPETLLPQREKVKVTESSIEIPVVFSNTNRLKSSDIVLFEINKNVNGSINNNKPLIPIKKINTHINDYSNIINILEFIKNPLKKEQLVY